MVKIEITQPGVFVGDPPKELRVGSQHTFKKEPVGWKNKYKVISTTEGKELKTSDAQRSEQMSDDERAAEIAKLQERYRVLSGKEPHGRWGIPKLSEEIATLEKDESPALVGSENFDDEIELAEGNTVPLGDVVARAHKDSELSVEEWNALEVTERDDLIEEAVEAMRGELADGDPD